MVAVRGFLFIDDLLIIARHKSLDLYILNSTKKKSRDFVKKKSLERKTVWPVFSKVKQISKHTRDIFYGIPSLLALVSYNLQSNKDN